MEYRIINLPAEDLGERPHREVFEEHLAAALSQGAQGVGLCLTPGLGSGTELLDWLESWQNAFAQKKRLLIIIPAGVRQMQDLELSHPDLNLQYASSVDELRRVYPAFAQAQGSRADILAAPPPPQAPLVQPAPVSVAPPPQPLPQAPSPEIPQSAPAPEAMPVVPEVLRVRPGEVVRISGEYACPGCGRTRMYAKGDRSTTCENPECRTPAKGWDLVFELF